MDKAVDVNVLKFKGWTIPFMSWETTPSILNVVVSPAVAEAHPWMPFMEIKNK